MLFIPAELDVAAHARTGRDRDRCGFDVADNHSGAQHVNLLGDDMADFIAAVPMAMFEEGGA